MKFAHYASAAVGLGIVLIACESGEPWLPTDTNVNNIQAVEVPSSSSQVAQLSSSADALSSAGTSSTGVSSATVNSSTISLSSSSIAASSTTASSTTASSAAISSTIKLSSSSAIVSSSSTTLSSSTIASSSSTSGTCAGLAKWNSVAWNQTTGKNFLNDAGTAAYSCDGTASCAWAPGNSQSTWVFKFNCN